MCPAGHKLKFIRKYEDKRIGSWTNVYRGNKCGNCKSKEDCIGNKNRYLNKEIKINPPMRKIRLRFKTKKGLEKYNKRFHKGEVAQTCIFHNLGYREFKMRSKKSCESEVNLFSIAYNLKKIHNKLKKTGRGLSDIIKKICFRLDYFYFVES
ncbi:MAG: transposase [Candidatus Woesearchaeota archaeon]